MAFIIQTPELMNSWVASHERVLNSLPHPSGGARDVEAAIALQTWDSELSKMHKVFSTALERRNELAPISALPAELLARVFTDLAAIWPVNSYSYESTPTTGGWSNTAMVCRRWRATAMDCASLWATVSLDGQEPIDLFLERAKACPLAMIGGADMYNEEDLERTERLIGCFDRFKYVDIHISRDYSDAPNSDALFFSKLTTKSNIASLSVRNDRAHNGGQRDNVQSGPSHTFISTLAPQLVTLNLEGYLFPWSAGSSTLQSLTLDWFGIASTQSQTFVNMLDSLKAMPALERLILAGSLPDIPQPGQGFIEQQPVIPLPRLKDLRLRCFNGTCWGLWALLDIDTAAHVSIHSDEPSSSLELVIMAFSRHINRPGFPDHKALKMWQNSPTSLSITLANTDDVEVEPLAGAGICMHIRSGLTSDLPLRILRAIPLHNLEIFNVRGTCYRWSYEDIAPLFAKAPRLRVLKLRGTPAAWAFCSLLLPESTLNEPVNEATLTGLPLPSLTELHIECVNLRTSTLSTYADYQRSLGDQLICALSLREVSQGHIHRLSVKRSKVALDWVPTWSSLVTNVDWDGEEAGDHQVEEQELSRRVPSEWGFTVGPDDWGSPVLGDQDEIDFLGEDAQSTGSFEWEAEGSSEEDEEEEEEIEEVWA